MRFGPKRTSSNLVSGLAELGGYLIRSDNLGCRPVSKTAYEGLGKRYPCFLATTVLGEVPPALPPKADMSKLLERPSRPECGRRVLAKTYAAAQRAMASAAIAGGACGFIHRILRQPPH